MSGCRELCKFSYKSTNPIQESSTLKTLKSPPTNIIAFLNLGFQSEFWLCTNIQIIARLYIEDTVQNVGKISVHTEIDMIQVTQVTRSFRFISILLSNDANFSHYMWLFFLY